MVGLYIVFAFDFQHTLGLILGILSGLTMAIFAVINSQFVMRIHPFTITFYEMAGACIGTVLFFPLYTTLLAPDGNLNLQPTWLDWLWIAAMAWACSVYAYTVALELMQKVSVFLISLTLNLEPVYGIIMAVLIFGKSEQMTVNFYLGALVILLAVLSYPFIKQRMSKKQ
jgi:drug/metabolite transporter (DMT)-like permease